MQILAEISENETEKLEGCWSGPEPDWRRIATVARQRQATPVGNGPRPSASDLNKNEAKRVAFISRIWDRTQDQLDAGTGIGPTQLEIISCTSSRSLIVEPNLQRGLHYRRREERPLPWRCLGRRGESGRRPGRLGRSAWPCGLGRGRAWWRCKRRRRARSGRGSGERPGLGEDAVLGNLAETWAHGCGLQAELCGK
jgi:hypothetical protein